MPETMLTCSIEIVVRYTKKETQGKESPEIAGRCVQHEQCSPKNDVDALDAINNYILIDGQYPHPDTWPISTSGKCTQ